MRETTRNDCQMLEPPNFAGIIQGNNKVIFEVVDSSLLAKITS